MLRAFLLFHHLLGAYLLSLASLGIMLSPSTAGAQAVDSFDPNPESSVLALTMQPDRQILAGGNFTNIANGASLRIARLANNGSLDTTFGGNAGNSILCLAEQPDGRVLAGGIFTTLNGLTRSYLGRFLANGTLDTNFNPVATGPVYSLLVQPDGRILVGGQFNSIGGVQRTNIARLNTDGNLDTTFNASAGNIVYSLALQPDGKIVVGGQFTTMNGATRNFLGRLGTNGTLDTTFTPAANSIVYAVAIQPDGKILTGGQFTTMTGVARRRLARLNSGGALDTTFNPGASNNVNTMVLQADGRILVGGAFTNLAGRSASNIGRLLNSGSPDTSFIAPASGPVYALALQPDGRILVGGAFTNLGGASRRYLGRLSNTDPPTNILVLSNTSITWLRGGSAPEIGWSRFEISTDEGTNWTLLGMGTRIAGGWQLTGLNLPGEAFIRARGSVAGGYSNGSNGLIEETAGPLILLAHPQSLTNRWSSNVTFTASVIGTTPVSYQWFKDGQVVDDTGTSGGAQSISLTLTNIYGGNAGGYSLVASNVTGSTTSQVATLTVIDPYLGTSPTNMIRNAGTNASFSVAIFGSSPLFYQWFKDGTPLTNNVNILGAQSSILSLSNLLGQATGGYSVVASNNWGMATSDVATLQVIDPVIGSQSTGQSLEAGQNLLLNITVSGSEPISYLWRRNGQDLPGPTGPSFAATNVQGSDAGIYSVVVSNQFGKITNTVAQVTVNVAAVDGSHPILNGAVNSVVIQTNGGVIFAGAFTTASGLTREYLARLKPDGTFDSTFNPSANDVVYCMAVQDDGTILTGGEFTKIFGYAASRLGKLNPDGTLVTSFPATASGPIYGMGIQSNGQFVVVGLFTNLNNVTRTNIGRFNAAGSLDLGFQPEVSGTIYTLALQTDGKILVGGSFTNLGGYSRKGLGRLKVDGTLETDFNPGASGIIRSIVVQPDGKILVGGAFTNMGGLTRSNLARLNADGSVDTNFTVAVSGAVFALALQTDRGVVVGGAFTNLGGLTRKYVARIDAAGGIDGNFNPGANDAVYALALQADGQTLVAGAFTNLAGQARSYLGRLSTVGTAIHRLKVSGSTVDWSRIGPAPEVWRVTLEISTNSVDWTNLGAGQRVSAGWQWSNLTIPAGAAIRGRGVTTSGNGNGSSGLITDVWTVEMQTPPSVLLGDGNFGFVTSQFGFTVSGRVGQVVIIEGSTNLINWTGLRTNHLPSESTSFADPNSGKIPTQFYRIRLF